MINPTNLQKEFRDKHKGKMAFLMGAGTSLSYINEDILRPYVTMAVNEAIFKLPDPTYFFSCDGGVYIYDLFDAVDPKETTQIIIIDQYYPQNQIGDLIQNPELEYNRGKHISHYHAFGRKQNRLDWRADPNDDKLLFGLSSVHCAAHMLNIMGCDPIVLLGCECKYTNDYYSFWMMPDFEHKERITKPLIKEAEAKNQSFSEYHIHAPQRGVGYNGVTDAFLGMYAQGWQQLLSQTPGIPIIDACDSIIPNIRKMSIENVLEVYGDRIK